MSTWHVVPRAIVVALLFAGCGDDVAGVTTPTTTAKASPVVMASPMTEAPIPQASSDFEPSTATPTPRAITGLFSEAEVVTAPDTLIELTATTTFAPWDGADVVVFDRIGLTERNLGPGSNAHFNPASTYMTWTAGQPFAANDVRLLDLSTGEVRDLGDGGLGWWLDDETLFVMSNVQGGLAGAIVDVTTGERKSVIERPNRPAAQRAATPSGRWDLRGTSRRFRLVDATGELGPLVFEAFAATLSPDGVLWVAIPVEFEVDTRAPSPQVRFVNIFEVEPTSGIGQYIATAYANSSVWPFTASATHVAWTGGICSFEDGDEALRHTTLYNRMTGEVVELDANGVVEFSDEGLLTLGWGFGTLALIDPATFMYAFLLPDGAIEVDWSPDGRFVALSFHSGHGGICDN